MRGRLHYTVLALTFALLVACGGADHPPPPSLMVDGLPVSGRLEDALEAGFTYCISYNAAVDLDGSDGSGGFDQVTLWHDMDQSAAIPLVTELERQGWRSCYTGEGIRGDQGIYTHPGAPARFSIDLSYWGKRRLRLIPEWNNRERRC
jgi:hypothetical protein